MLLLPLTVTACAPAPAPQPATRTVVTAPTSVITTTKIPQTVTTTATPETTVEPADALAAQSAYTLQDVRVPSQGPTELVIQDVRAGSHDGFDRVVFEYAGPGLPGYIAGYNPDPRQQASGYPLEGLTGGAFLELMIQGTPMMLMPPREELLRSGPVGVAAGNIQSVVNGGVFEADSQYVIGLDRQRPFNIYTLENPPRLVIDFQQ